MLQVIMERSESELKDTYARFLPLGLGLVYLARQEAAEAVIVALGVIFLGVTFILFLFSSPFCRNYVNIELSLCR